MSTILKDGVRVEIKAEELDSVFENIIDPDMSDEIRLYELDKKTIRPLRSILSGNGTEEDEAFLKSLDEEAKKIRSKGDI